MFGLMYRLGLRACEVVRLLLEDLDLARGRVRVRRAKSGDSKVYPLPRDLQRPLQRWLRHRRAQGPFLFNGRESTNQRGLTVLRVQQLFKRYAAEAGLQPEVASHSLRHSIAVHALDAGFGLEHVQDLLGHTSIRSTAIYARVSSRARDGMMEAMERIIREIRRRTRVVGNFPDGESALMLVAARLRHIAGTKWGSRRYLDMELLDQVETVAQAG